MRLVTVLMLFIACSKLGASDIVFPTAPVTTVSPPKTEIKLEPVTSIKPGELYVIGSTTGLRFVFIPDGLVKIQEFSQPVTFFSLFSGGTEPELRTFDYPHVYALSGVKDGKTAMVVVPLGEVTPTTELGPIHLTVTTKANPPPTPDPEPNPDPTPPPVVKSFRVIFIKESGVTLNSAQSAIPGAYAIRTYLREKTTVDDGQPGWREYDPQQTTVTEPKIIQDLWAAIQPKINTVPCMAIEVNTKVEILPFPANAAEALKTLKKYGGE